MQGTEADRHVTPIPGGPVPCQSMAGKRHLRASLPWGAACVASAALATVCAAGASAAGTGNTVKLWFSPNKPKMSTGMNVSLSTPQMPISAAVTLPAGMALNLQSVPDCASPPACGPNTQVGTGTATVHYSKYTIPLLLLLFNTQGGLAIVIENPNGSPYLVSPTWSGDTLQITYPQKLYQGYPILVSKFTLNFNKIGSGSRAYMRTPATCTKRGWSSTTTFTVSAGVTQPVTAAAKCTVAKKKKKHKKR